MSVVNCQRCGAGVYTGQRLTEMPRVSYDTINEIRAAARALTTRHFMSPEHARTARELEVVATTLEHALAAAR